MSFLLDDDWEVFSSEIQALDLAQELLTSILYADLRDKERYDFPDFDGLFCRQPSSLEDAWDERAYSALDGEIPKRPDEALVGTQIADEPPGSLEVAFEDMATLYKPERNLYRARIHDDRRRTSRFTAAEVGAPPPEKAKAGRANQEGRPVLYLASNKSTALAEVRPWKGAAVALAEVALKRELLLVDLTQRQSVKSPFFVELLKWKSELAGLLYRLGQDMSRPVMRHEEGILYRPTQLLALMIQAAGYHGCIFPSAMGSGKNIVLFDVNAAEIVSVDYVRVTRAAFFSTLFSEYDDVYDEGPYDHALASD
ncbi:RES family NAD+ phosphorylase [Ochrobactrum sp. 3-3]|uniref:RES family NAD+ phosphorylase n=1 Tax=Ochrobactrum sp. 3-3 TaxID=1830124 RepID=UPI0013B3B229|nr:RES family NAD+ phosphorylase [Ochrobactrum sp. 3-3]